MNILLHERDKPGAKAIEDCKPCPKGTFGDEAGLATSECSGRCSSLDTIEMTYYGDEDGLTSRGQCKEYPKDYFIYDCHNNLMELLAAEMWHEYKERNAEHHS